MRPLFHPSIEEITVEGILHALSDPDRVAIYSDIVNSGCAQSCSSFLKSTVSQRFKVLREAGLIRGERHGVEVQNSSRCAEIEGRFPGLIRAIVKCPQHSAAKNERPPRDKVGAKSPPDNSASARRPSYEVQCIYMVFVR